jgi:hypothetical protein
MLCADKVIDHRVEVFFLIFIFFFRVHPYYLWVSLLVQRPGVIDIPTILIYSLYKKNVHSN